MSSFFPSPPAYHVHFTASNIALARRLVAAPTFSQDEYRRLAASGSSKWTARQAALLAEIGRVDGEQASSITEAGVDLPSLVQPPDAALIEADGHWMSFGQAWPVRASGRLPLLMHARQW
jgi:hypothetical protein